jgi:hypothetical protein
MHPIKRRDSPKNPLLSNSEEESFDGSASEIYEDEENIDVDEYSVDDDIDDVQGIP